MSNLEMSIRQGYHSSLWLRRRWDANKGSYHYELQKVTNLNGHFVDVVASGSKDWADRTSAHYGLKITDGADL